MSRAFKTLERWEQDPALMPSGENAVLELPLLTDPTDLASALCSTAQAGPRS